MLRKEIKNYPNYTIDVNGNVHKENCIIKSHSNGIGYLQIQLSKNGLRKHFYIHRLVYEMFSGDILFEINHIDCDKSNNNIDNLEDISHSDNLKHSVELSGGWGSCKKNKV